MSNSLPEILDNIETCLQRLDLWHEKPPASKDLQSSTPFCADSLTLYQWLQWVFLPKIRQLLKSDALLPANCAIVPYAEIVIDTNILRTDSSYRSLMVWLKHCDNFFSTKVTLH